MNFVNYIKKFGTRLPYSTGACLAAVPFGIRPVIGKTYREAERCLSHVSQLQEAELKSYIFNNVRNIVNHGYRKTKFYREFYEDKNFTPRQLKSFEDISLIPIVKKSDLVKYPLDARSVKVDGRYLVNTGGSSGTTLDMYITPDSIGREWGHMHDAWRRVNFNHKCVKVVFSGQSRDGDPVFYDSARHQFNVNVYLGWAEVNKYIYDIYKKYRPKYIHGYPGAIFDYVVWLEKNDSNLFQLVRESTIGLMLSSEYPNPVIRQEIEALLGCSSVSWYGHTERSVLAREVDVDGVYVPYQSYGYCEVIAGDLLGTSYLNFASPLIRYNTEDNVEGKLIGGIVVDFTVAGGRKSEHVYDRRGKKIFLTALIYGRHHKLFDFVSSIQIRQKNHGHIEVLYVSRAGQKINFDPALFFDISGVDISANYLQLDKPVANNNGKVPLLVRE